MQAKSTQKRKIEKTTPRDDARHTPGRSAEEMLAIESEMSPAPRPAVKRLFLSRADVSRLFGVSASTVTRWARLGLLKAVRTPGGHYRFPAEETYRAAQRGASAELTRLD
jgi:excisionase family DNA binding protein